MTNSDTLVGIFENIGTSLEGKGLTGPWTPPQMPAAIDSISGGGFDYTGLSGLKFSYNTDTQIDVSDLDTSEFTSGAHMFNHCVNLTSVDLSNFDTSNMNTMASMFAYCSALTSIDVSGFVTSNVTRFEQMFSNCSGLTSVDISNFSFASTSGSSAVSNMFNSCTNLQTLVLPQVFDPSGSAGYFLNGCTALQNVNWSSFVCSRTDNLTGMFRGVATSNMTTLDLGNLEPQNATNHSGLLQNNNALRSVNLKSYVTTAATNMASMIAGSVNLQHIIWALESTTVQPMVTAKAFDYSTSTMGSAKSIYVRDSLVNGYKAATNWNRYIAWIKPISECPQDVLTLYNIDPSDYQ